MRRLLRFDALANDGDGRPTAAPGEGAGRPQRADTQTLGGSFMSLLIGQSIIQTMLRLQAFKYELMPNGEPTRDLRRFTGSRRFVFNQARALQKTTYEAGGKKLGVAGLCQQLTARRNGSETPWLKDAPVHPLQQSHKDLERAHEHFFAKRALFPRFKR